MGERSCVNIFGLYLERSWLRASMGISARSFSLAERLGAAVNGMDRPCSLMLDFERRREDHEIDVELRYTTIRLESIGGTSAAAKGSTNASTVSLWARLRAPTGQRIFERPLRYVLDGAHSRFLGDQSDALGPNYMSQVGAGLEVDAMALGIGVGLVRLIARYLFGGEITGATISFALTF